jgi:hypothetical protein
MSLVRKIASSVGQSYLRINSSLASDTLQVRNPPEKPVFDRGRIFKKISDQLSICRMNQADMHYVMSTWALQEKWTPTQFTIEAFYAADPNGYYMLFNNDEPVASLAAVCYPTLKIAFLGLYLVEKTQRKNGYSKILWDNVVADLKSQGYALGLNASPYAALATPDFYRKLTFEEMHTDQAWQLKDALPLPAMALPPGIKVVELTDELVDQVVSYDSRIFGQDRKDFLVAWMKKPDTFTFVALLNDQVAGYVVASQRVLPLEPEKKSYRIGPLYADNADFALGLVHNVLSAVKEARPIVIDLPGTNIPVAEKVMQHFGFSFFYNSVHMFTKKPVMNNDEKVFGKSALTIAHI